ncbi:SIR2 family protein [Algoriphagus sp. NG3]|uniref:SIR2 family protein n=1 Tax=Algoriphagus sp. NG3 TaxID=3097546 RepID=UPI002A80AEA4|nr:SIR2 family protein [Algoriphagus sp. NG3]WPR73825.1 SIR2 family protein [Algoriphagus sp. NG3]
MNEPKKKRKVFLLGAGAAMSWGGPSTAKVTDLILGKLENENTTHANSQFTNLIYNFLVYKSSQSPEKVQIEINFEDIISVVEELILYYHIPIEEGEKRILPHFFDLKPDFEKDLEACFSNGDGIYENLVDSLNAILRSIRLFVHKYSRHLSNEDSKILPCDQHFDLCEKKERIYLVSLFNAWASKIGLDHSFIRSYTLNYDKLYKVLFENYMQEKGKGADVQIFQGFIEKSPDANQILFNREQNCHYNLHGSTYWHLSNHKESYGLEEFVFELGDFPYLEFTEEQSKAHIKLEVGRPFVLSNIIAGYRKIQRSFNTPFKQMHASFEMDCLQADEMYIIGYSFSDAHINSSIRSAFIGNKKMKVYIVDPSFNLNSFNKLVTEVFPELFNEEKLVNEGCRKEGIYYKFDKLFIFPMKFEEYLKHMN